MKKIDTALTAAFAAALDGRAPQKDYLRAKDTGSVQILEGCTFLVGGDLYESTSCTLTESDLDTGSFTVGADYGIYLCKDGDTARPVISRNATYPDGFADDDCRQIGGFHYGMVRVLAADGQPVGTDGKAFGEGWKANVAPGILPASVWTLQHRPSCDPRGMVYLGSGTWVDIYIASDDGQGGLRSAWHATPMTGAEGANWYIFQEKLLRSGKRMLRYSEFCRAAYGSPEGEDETNENCWSAAFNTARNMTGFVPNAVSALGCADCCGTVWEWVDEVLVKPDPEVPAPAPGEKQWVWYDETPMEVNGGNLFHYYNTTLATMLAGGDWVDGEHSGTRAANIYRSPWKKGIGFGTRGACDSL
ncbi:hypothetical protein H8K20_05145 [Neobittarella massiliensis]|uniref:Major tropism determinant second domain-containing protein n=1 Tax=Neobittarella massiliensis (ex Bilen et al. 2018) TaxID=2041842 RepID=A0A8J6INW8_9FIRM|nr:hypothetical protein [Neobittarella massiliensis]MBC3515788.1 hypothetical protein [Neobittarella massiliensis]